MQWMIRAVCRNTDARIFLLESCAVVYSFTASAFHTDTPSVTEDPLAILKLAIPTVVVLSVLMLRNAWTGDSERSQLASTVDVSLAFGLVALSQMELWRHFPALVLPRWRPTQGSWAAWLVLTELRTLFPPRSAALRRAEPETGLRMCWEEIHWKAQELGRVRLRNNVWIRVVAAAAVVGCGACFLLTGKANVRFGAALIIAGALYAAWQGGSLGSSLTVPAGHDFEQYSHFCLHELDRQRRLLSRLRYTLIGSLIPGLMLFLAGSVVYAYVLLLHVLVATELFYRAALHLRREHGEIAFARAPEG
jgi:hypothetical protein